MQNHLKIVALMVTLCTGTGALFSTKPPAKPATSNRDEKTKKPTKATQDDQIYTWLKTVSEVCSSLRERPFRTIDFEEAFKEGLKSIVNSADAHSAFFTPESYKKALESASGEFPGIGISVTYKEPNDSGLVVISVVSGGPFSDKVGLKAKDKIVSIDGEHLKGLSTDEVIDKLKGKVGTKVKIKVTRDDKEPLEFTIKRDTIKDQSSMAYHFIKQNVYYISLKIFAENSADQMGKFIKHAVKNGSNGMIIDIRRNPGGVLESAIDLVGLFTPKGSPVVTTKNNEHKLVKKYLTLREPLFNGTMPIFLIIDSFSASAAEIFAGCMRHYSDTNSKLMVFLVGSTSFGKGSVQEVFPISNGCALKLTTMLYYLPDDTSIQASGVKPDFSIKPKMIPKRELDWINDLYGKETALKRHITKDEVDRSAEKDIDKEAQKEEKEAAAKKAKKPGSSERDDDDEDETAESIEEKQKKSLIQDVQIQTCINMMSMLKLAKKACPERIKSRKEAVAFLHENFVTDDDVDVQEVK